MLDEFLLIYLIFDTCALHELKDFSFVVQFMVLWCVVKSFSSLWRRWKWRNKPICGRVWFCVLEQLCLRASNPPVFILYKSVVRSGKYCQIQINTLESVPSDHSKNHNTCQLLISLIIIIDRAESVSILDSSENEQENVWQSGYLFPI